MRVVPVGYAGEGVRKRKTRKTYFDIQKGASPKSIDFGTPLFVSCKYEETLSVPSEFVRRESSHALE